MVIMLDLSCRMAPLKSQDIIYELMCKMMPIYLRICHVVGIKITRSPTKFSGMRYLL